jgi:hypothetical protein
MSKPKKTSNRIAHYFVDEAGDSTLFDSKGRIIIGAPGCSRFFILGLADIPEPEPLYGELETLRANLLADPYFKRVPSMHPTGGKTALAFHAKDDLPEVRREVMAVLRRHPLRFFAVVRDKQKIADYVRQRNERESAYRYNPNELYDAMVRRLFKTRLHKDDEYNITFAKRGNADRTTALEQALQTARQRFALQWNIVSTAPIRVIPSTPQHSVGLQVADYLMWALQRCYERREDRFVELLWQAFRLVHDVDDTRRAQYGAYYTKKKPLTVAALDSSADIGVPNRS